MNKKGELKAKITTRIKKYNDGDVEKEPKVEEKTFYIEKGVIDFFGRK
jgi:hypothetical protein